MFRKNINLPSWMNNYIKLTAEKYGRSDSEIIRMIVIHFLFLIAEKRNIHKKHSLDELLNITSNMIDRKIPSVEERELYEELEFEAQKIAEKRMKELKELPASPPPKQKLKTQRSST